MTPTPSERSRFALLCLTAVTLAAACGEVEAPGTPSTTTPYSTTDTGGTPVETRGGTTLDLGTQVGSEGVFGCRITEVNELQPSDLVPGTDVEASKAAVEVSGGWMLLFDVIGRGTEDGGLFVDNATRFALVKTDGACGAYVEARVTGVLDRADSTVAVEGLLALSADVSAIRLSAPSSDGDVREAWGDPSAAELAFLRVDAELDADGTTLSGAVTHAECLEPSCRSEELALFVGSR